MDKPSAVSQVQISEKLQPILDSLFKDYPLGELEVTVAQNQDLMRSDLTGNADVVKLFVSADEGKSPKSTVVNVDYPLGTPMEELQGYAQQARDYWAQLNQG